MTDVTADQRILADMARLLGELVDPAYDMQRMIYRGQIFPDVSSGQAFWIDSRGGEHSYGELPDGLPGRVVRAMDELAAALQETPAFARSGFTHFELTLDRDRALRLRVEDIPREQTRLGLFMRTISSLTWPEADELGIPLAEWEALRAP